MATSGTAGRKVWGEYAYLELQWRRTGIDYITGKSTIKVDIFSSGPISEIARSAYSITLNGETKSGIDQPKGTNIIAATEYFTVDHTNGASVSLRGGYSQVINIGTAGTVSWSGSIATLDAISTAPSAVTDVTATRNTDNQSTVSWTNNVSGTKVYAKHQILRSTDGGSYVQIGETTCDPATSQYATSYVDTTIQPNHYYSYKVVAWNVAGTATSSVSNTIYTTPNAPSGFTGVFAKRDSDMYVALTWGDTSNSEDGFVIENSSDKSDFSNPLSVIAPANSTSYDFSGYRYDSQGNAYFRIIAKRGTKGQAGYIESTPSQVITVKTLTSPSEPTNLSPESGTILDMPREVTFKWTHQPNDGTPQTAYKLRYRLSSSQTWQTVSGGSTSSHTISSTSPLWARGSVIYWQVCTKGSFDSTDQYGTGNGYSPWSAQSTLKIDQSPSFTISQPVSQDGGYITSVPIVVDGTYSDNGRTMSRASVVIKDTETLYSNNNVTSFPLTIPASELTPKNNTDLSLYVTVFSPSGLSSTSVRNFSTLYEEPNPPRVDYTIDAESLSITATVNEGTGESEIEVESFSLSIDGNMVATDFPAGSSVTYPIPPINRDFTITAYAYAQSGAVAQSTIQAMVKAPGEMYWNFGDGMREYAHMKLGPNVSDTATTDAELVQFEGDDYPTVYQGNSIDNSLPVSGVLHDLDRVSDFTVKLRSQKGARCVYRDSTGGVCPVSVIGTSASHQGGAYRWDVSVEQRRAM